MSVPKTISLVLLLCFLCDPVVSTSLSCSSDGLQTLCDTSTQLHGLSQSLTAVPESYTLTPTTSPTPALSPLPTTASGTYPQSSLASIVSSYSFSSSFSSVSPETSCLPQPTYASSLNRITASLVGVAVGSAVLSSLVTLIATVCCYECCKQCKYSRRNFRKRSHIFEARSHSWIDDPNSNDEQTFTSTTFDVRHSPNNSINAPTTFTDPMLPDAHTLRAPLLHNNL